jgi:hypothetical protein
MTKPGSSWRKPVQAPYGRLHIAWLGIKQFQSRFSMHGNTGNLWKATRNGEGFQQVGTSVPFHCLQYAYTQRPFRTSTHNNL